MESSPLCICFAIMGAFFDSLSGFFQIDIRKKYKPTPFMFMDVISFYTCLISAAACVATGELGPAASLLATNPLARFDMLILSLSNILGLFFIFLGLSELGPIKLAFVTSSRKVISVLASILVFGKSIDWIQGFGITLVLSGMLFENFYSGSKKPAPVKDEAKTGTNKKES